MKSRELDVAGPAFSQLPRGFQCKIFNLQSTSRPSAGNNHFKIVFAVKCLKTKANVAKKDGWTYEPIEVDIRS